MEFWQQLTLVVAGAFIAFVPTYLVDRWRRRHDRADRLRELYVRFAAEVTRTQFETLMLRRRMLSSGPPDGVPSHHTP